MEPTKNMKKEIIQLHDYAIYLGDFWEHLQTTLLDKQFTKVFVLVDDNTYLHCLPVLKEKTGRTFDHIVRITPGEAHKTLETCQKIWNFLFDHNADRKSLLINLGGGVIGDMGGFCASTYMRGIAFIQIPTTLLAQVDASIGGKTGIDYHQLKNSIGLFQNPIAVYINPIFLRTLPDDHTRSGYAEIVKHGLIQDALLFEKILRIKTLDDISWVNLIGPSLHVKKRVVEKDPLESGFRKVLNFGHTIGHALESVRLDKDQPLLHGDAVAFGMITEGFLSQRFGTLPETELETISQYILSIFGKVRFQSADVTLMLTKMRSDKKNEYQQINFSLLSELGKAEINRSFTDDQIIESFDYYLNLAE
jgi:3-dehydroquinate synthase